MAFGMTAASWPNGGAGFASPSTVDLLAPRGSRLAEDLRREMGASGFAVVIVESKASDWRADVRRLPGNERIHGVVVRADDRLMTVFTRWASADAIDAQLEEPVEPGDRMARRRACLSVVEYLRVLSENDPPAPLDPITPPAGGPPRAGGPAPTQAPATRSPDSPPVPSVLPSPAVAPPPPPAPSETPAFSPIAPASAPGGPPGLPVPAQAVASAPPTGKGPPLATATGANRAATPFGGAVAVGEKPHDPHPGDSRDSPDAPEPGERAWEVGVGSTLELDAAPGGPTGDLQFLWYLPLEWRLALCVRALWPVLGGQFRTGGNDVRVWTFGGAASLQYLFNIGPGRLRPFVGTSLGSRVALTETTPTTALQSRESFTPSLTLGGDAGVRYTLSPLVQLFVEVGVVRGWLVPGMHRAAYEEGAANSNSIHASFGVMFEI
jgi:hypothetical protein